MNDHIEMDRAGRISGVIWGTLASKSNSRRIVRIRCGNGMSRPMIIRSAEARSFEARFKEVVATAGLKGIPIKGPVGLVAVIYQKDRRRDLDVALLQDAIQRSGLVVNDRQVEYIFARKKLDREHPRIEFKVIGY